LGTLPFWINDLLIVGAIGCFVGAIWALLIRPEQGAIRARFVGATLLGVIIAGILAVVLIIKNVGTSDARLAYVALSAWAIMLVYGATTVGVVMSTRFAPRVSSYLPFVWPAAMLLVDIYVMVHFLVPFGGL
jgi:hypothetical protein